MKAGNWMLFLVKPQMVGVFVVMDPTNQWEQNIGTIYVCQHITLILWDAIVVTIPHPEQINK